MSTSSEKKETLEMYVCLFVVMFLVGVFGYAALAAFAILVTFGPVTLAFTLAIPYLAFLGMRRARQQLEEYDRAP